MTFNSIMLIIYTIILILTLFRVVDLTNKFKRIKKRYDRLLRGRGELNIEELLAAHSNDIDITKNKIKSLEKSNESISLDLSNFNKDLQFDFNNNLESVKEEYREKIDFLEKSQEEIYKNINRRLEEGIKNTENNVFTAIQNNEQSVNSQIKKIKEDQYYSLENIKEEIEKYKDATSQKLDKEIKSMREDFATAISNVYLYKYDAFENQTGKLSFTLVLLDEFYNGLLITTINGRDSSYLYSKEIKLGKADVELSLEEENALNKALNKKNN